MELHNLSQLHNSRQSDMISLLQPQTSMTRSGAPHRVPQCFARDSPTTKNVAAKTSSALEDIQDGGNPSRRQSSVPSNP